VGESDDVKVIILVFVEQHAEFFHKLEALFTKVRMLFKNHELLNGFYSHVSVENNAH